MGRILVCSDLHGQLDIFYKIKASLKPDDKVYFLGDAADRGQDGWQIIKEILQDKRFKYLLGNHEDMLINACKEYVKNEEWQWGSYNLCYMNGGEPTMKAWLEDPDRLFWLGQLFSLPTWTYIECNNRKFILSHAGFTPWVDPKTDDIIIPSTRSLIWNRDHFFDTPNDEDIDTEMIMIHGHTPISNLAKRLNVPIPEGALWYSNNMKCCIDCGTAFTGKAILLDLATLEYETFYSGDV